MFSFTSYICKIFQLLSMGEQEEKKTGGISIVESATAHSLPFVLYLSLNSCANTMYKVALWIGQDTDR